jgi:TatA/E family protein of Tat protein translocase
MPPIAVKNVYKKMLSYISFTSINAIVSDFKKRKASDFRRLVMVGDLLSPMHLLVILAIALIVFGPGKLPELGSSLGKAIKEFKKVMNDPDKLIK